MSEMNTFRENLKKIRKSKRITLKELAESCGVQEATVQRYESGVISNIPYDKLVAISNALDVSPAALMGWQEPEETAAINAAAILMNNNDALLERLITIYHDLPESKQQLLVEIAENLK